MFPDEIMTLIYTFDNTYHEYFKVNIIPRLNSKWSIMYNCLYTGKSGLISFLPEVLISNFDYDLVNKFYNYNNCLKFCFLLKKKLYGYSFEPIYIR